MNPIDEIFTAAASDKKRIALAEGEDPRIIQAALRALKYGLAHPILIGDPAVIEPQLKSISKDAGHIEIQNPLASGLREGYVNEYMVLRARKGVTEEQARRAMSDPIGFATMMVRRGQADGSVGGAVATTADTVRAALQIIGPAPGIKTISSYFLMILGEDHHLTKGAFIFSDCGMIVEPSMEELADIAITSARSYETLFVQQSRIAMLSFSTRGSAKHARVTKVAEATGLVRRRRPDLVIDGELQFDAAFVPEVQASKAPGSELGGPPNVLIFPNLDAGNIGYKIAQRIGGAQAVGPILQGLAKPANDLSRGCSAEDVLKVLAVTSVQAQRTDRSGDA